MATSGKYLQLTVGGVPFHKGVQKWSSEDLGEDLDDVDAESNGYDDVDVSIRGLRLTIEILWNLIDGPFPAIRRGMTLTEVRAFANRLQATPDYYLPLARVMKRSRAVEVRGQIKATLEIRSRGPFQEDGVTVGTET